MMPHDSLNSSLRVALVARGASVAGGEVSLLTLARHLPAPWTPCIWVTEEGELAERAESLGLELVRGSWEFLSPRRPAQALRRVRETARAFEAQGIDLVHVNSPVEAAEFLGAAVWSRRPSLVHIRIAYEQEFLRKQGLALADEIIFNSHALRNEIGWAGGSVVPNGVELPGLMSSQERQARRSELGASEHECLFGQVGQVIHTKGVDLSLEALAHLAPSESPWRFVVIGEDHQNDGEYRRCMEARAEDLGVKDRVRFVGYRRDALALMGALDVLLCPSRAEPFGRVLIEAMSQRVPVVASRVGGIPEVLVDGSEGYLVPSESPHALREAAQRLARDPGLRAGMGRRGRARAEQIFSAKAHAERIAAIYERVAAPYLRSGMVSA